MELACSSPQREPLHIPRVLRREPPVGAEVGQIGMVGQLEGSVVRVFAPLELRIGMIDRVREADRHLIEILVPSRQVSLR